MTERQREDDVELAHRIPHAFSFGSPVLPGLAKIVEEYAEAGVPIGKLMMTGGDSAYWEGRELVPELFDELADLRAAIEFFVELNLSSPDATFRFDDRVQRKKRLFREWHGRRSEKYARENPSDPSV